MIPNDSRIRSRRVVFLFPHVTMSEAGLCSTYFRNCDLANPGSPVEELWPHRFCAFFKTKMSLSFEYMWNLV